MRKRVTHENNLSTRKLLQQSFTTLFTKYMTHLPSLVVFCALIPEYWHYQIQTLVSTLKYKISFFYRIPQIDFWKHFSPFFLWFNPLYLQGFHLDWNEIYWRNKLMYALHFRQISPSKSETKIWYTYQFYTDVQKFSHLLSPSYRSHQIRILCSSMTKHFIHKKSWGFVWTWHALKMYIKNINHLSSSTNNRCVMSPSSSCSCKTPSSHQVPAIRNTYSYDC